MTYKTLQTLIKSPNILKWGETFHTPIKLTRTYKWGETLRTPIKQPNTYKWGEILRTPIKWPNIHKWGKTLQTPRHQPERPNKNLPHHKGGRHFIPSHLETNKPIDMEVDEEATDYMDEDPIVLMLREEGTYWKPPTIVEATTKLKN